MQLSAISPASPFAIRYAGFVPSRFTVRPDGRTPFQYLLGTPYVSPLCMFGESVFALIPDHEVRAAKLTNRWISGWWWGRTSDKHLVGTKHSLLKCRSVRRKQPGEQWSRRFLRNLGWHEGWDQTQDTAASSFSLEGLDLGATSSPTRFEWEKVNLDTGAAVNTFPLNFGPEGAGDGRLCGTASGE